MKRFLFLSLIAVMALVFAGCGASNETNANAPSAEPTVQPSETVQLTISAAASMTDALTEIQKRFESQHSNIKLSFNFGASGALQQQIEQGAPADLFLSAASKNMKALMDKGLIEDGKQTNLVNNELVAIVPTDRELGIRSIADLSKAEVKTVAIGIPESVPAGNYAKEALTNAKAWESLQTKSVQAKDVRGVQQYVETGNADAGFVYKTDALTSDKVKIAFVVDPATYSAIQYPLGIVKATKHAAEAEAFYAYLQSQAVLDVFVKYGFSLAE